MKILLVTQYFWPESFRVNDLVRGWEARGHEVTVLAGLPNYPSGRLFSGYSWRGPYRESYGAAAVRRVPIVTRGARQGFRLLANYVSFVFSAMALGPLVVRGRFDVAFAYAPSPITICIPALWFKFLRGMPVAFWVQDLWPDNLLAVRPIRSPWLLKAITVLCRGIYRRCDLVLVQSPDFVEPIARVCPEVGVLHVLPNWADDHYQPGATEDWPERREWPAGFSVMFAGNLGSAQGLEAVLDAAEALRDDNVHWVFIGDGNRRAWLETQVRERGLGSLVHFLGWRRPEVMPRYLSLADALLVSLRRNASFASTIPSKLQTSLAMGRPVLAALGGIGARIVADAGAGVVVEQENGAALAAGVRALLDAGADGRARMGQNGRSYAVQHFDRETLLTQLDEWLQEMVEAQR
ncbi:MAG: glycosyltransferase family 4 protein [Vicinamibacterales bacterium]